jgi:D-3-phosphoglycerate dehydrogenase
MEQQVNIVNARMLASERGVEVVEQASMEKGDFSSLIKVSIQSDKETITIAGTLFGNQYLRLVQFGSHRLDAHMDGVLLIFTHKDVPGLIGHIGTICGKNGVNIAQMNVGRQNQGGEAIAVLNLDARPPESVLKEVSSHPQIRAVTVLDLPPAGELPTWFA